MSAPRVFRWLLVAFVVGVGGASYFPSLSSSFFFLSLALGGAFFIFGLWRRSAYQRWLILGGLILVFALGAYRILISDAISSARLSFPSSLYLVKEAFREKLTGALPEPQASFAASLLLGARENPSRELREAFRRSGTSHIVAISGWNITIIAQFLFGLLLGFTLWRNVAFWLTIAGVTLFALMVGGEASVVRAAIMGSLLLLAKRSGRLPAAANALVFAAVLMLVWDPRLLRWDIGFQLSFLATLGMIHLVPYFEERVFARLPKILAFRETVAATLSAQIFVLPVLLSHFETLSFVALPANLAVLPFIPVTMLFSFLAGLAGFFSHLISSLFGSIAYALLSFELATIRFFASLAWAEITFSLPVIALALYYLVLALWIRRIRTVPLEIRN